MHPAKRNFSWYEVGINHPVKFAFGVFSKIFGMYFFKLVITFFCFFIQQGTSLACSGNQLVLMWQVPKTVSRDELAQMKSMGVSLIHHFQLANWSDREIFEYLAAAYQSQLKVLLFLGHILEHQGKSDLEWILGEKAKSFVEKWKKHPAVYGWHTFDEPKELGKRARAKSQEEIYRGLKVLDSLHPVIVSMNRLSKADYDQFFSDKAFDILEMHAYPNSSNLEWGGAQLILNLRAHSTRDYPVWVTLRAFNGEGWSIMGSDSLDRQYDLACQSPFVKGIAFYGWKLGPNKGIADDLTIKNQFTVLMSKVKKMEIAE